MLCSNMFVKISFPNVFTRTHFAGVKSLFSFRMIFLLMPGQRMLSHEIHWTEFAYPFRPIFFGVSLRVLIEISFKWSCERTHFTRERPFFCVNMSLVSQHNGVIIATIVTNLTLEFEFFFGFVCTFVVLEWAFIDDGHAMFLTPRFTTHSLISMLLRFSGGIS